jgi:uncharacterized membrane protein
MSPPLRCLSLALTLILGITVSVSAQRIQLFTDAEAIHDASYDGKTLVGVGKTNINSFGGYDAKPARWFNPGSGFTSTLLTNNTLNSSGPIFRISGNGQVIAAAQTISGSNVGFSWSNNSITSLPFVPNDISDDGQVIVGTGTVKQGNTFTTLSSAQGYSLTIPQLAVDGTGSQVVGVSNGIPPLLLHYQTATATTTNVLANYNITTTQPQISKNGQYIAGVVPNGIQLVNQRNADVLHQINNMSTINGISDRGTVVGSQLFFSSAPFIVTRQGQFAYVNDLLAGYGATNPVTRVLSISPDGRYITGSMTQNSAFGPTPIGFLADISGWTQEIPIQPTSTTQSLPNQPPVFQFNNVPSGQWFDPIPSDRYQFNITSPGSAFAKILNFPTGFTDPFEVWANNNLLGSFGPGQVLDFQSLLGSSVNSFEIRGINPLVDGENPNAFPIQLEFTTSTASFSMQAQAIPEPSTWFAICCGGCVVFYTAWKRSRVRLQINS